MVPFDIATKRVVFVGCRFICRIVTVGAPGCIMCEVDTTLIAELILLSPCTCAGSGTITSDYAAIDGVWELRGWPGWCAGGLVLLGHHCCHFLSDNKLLEEDAGC